MALNPKLIRGAGGIITGLGAAASILPLSPNCRLAIQMGVESKIRAACGPLFGNTGLIAVMVIGGIVMILLTFWQDIGQALFVRESDR